MGTTLCVLGATGLTGSAIVNEVLNKGVGVLALMQSPENVTIQHDQQTVMKADMLTLESADIVQAIGKCDHVVIALGSKELWGDTIRSEGTKSDKGHSCHLVSVEGNYEIAGGD